MLTTNRPLAPSRRPAPEHRRGLSPLYGGVAIAGLAAALLAVCPRQALAQTAEQTVDIEDVSVLQRPRPEYQARGIHLGAFTIYPRVTITPEYDDNIYATDTDKVGDFITAIAPSIRFQSNWSRNELDGYANAVTNIFANNSNEGTTDYALGGSGRLDLADRTNVTASFNYAHSTEARTAENTVTAARDPIQYDVVGGQVGASHTFNRLTISAQAGASRYDYQDAVTFSGAPLSQQYRNVTQEFVSSTATYSLNPAVSVFTTLRYDERNYDLKPPQVPFDRTSDGLEGTIGVNLELSRLLRGFFEFGYFERNYNQANYPVVDGPALHGRIEYYYTPLTTITVTADRSVIDAADPVAISAVQTHGGIQIDHELRRNIILSARASYEYDDYDGIDRQDSRPSASVSGTYLLNRRVGITAAYTYLDQSSSGAFRTNNFAVNVVSLSLVLQL